MSFSNPFQSSSSQTSQTSSFQSAQAPHAQAPHAQAPHAQASHAQAPHAHDDAAPLPIPTKPTLVGDLGAQGKAMWIAAFGGDPPRKARCNAVRLDTGQTTYPYGLVPNAPPERDAWSLLLETVRKTLRPIYGDLQTASVIVSSSGCVYLCSDMTAMSLALSNANLADPSQDPWSLSPWVLLVWDGCRAFAATPGAVYVVVGGVMALALTVLLIWIGYVWLFVFMPRVADSLRDSVWVLRDTDWFVRYGIALALNVIEGWGIFLIRSRVLRTAGIAASALYGSIYMVWAYHQSAAADVSLRLADAAGAFFSSIALEPILILLLASVIPLWTLVPAMLMIPISMGAAAARRLGEERRHSGDIVEGTYYIDES